MKKLDKTTQEWADKNTRLKAIKVQMDGIYDSIGLTNMSLKELKNRQNEVNMILARMSPSMAGYKELKAQSDAIGARMKELKVQTQATGSSVSKFADGINKYSAMAIGYAAAVMGVVYSFKKLYDAAEEQRIADKRLLFALNGNITAFKELNKQSGELQMATGIEDSMISQIQMLGISSGKSTEDVKKITEAAIELSSITGDDLQASFMQLNKTFTGVLGKSLPRLSTDFANLSKEQLQNGDAIEMVLSKYRGTAATSASEVSKLTQAWGEFQEALGKGTLGPIDWLAVRLTSLLGIARQVAEEIGGSMVDSFNKQVDTVVDLTQNLNPLLTRYDELKSKSKLSKDEQSELSIIIKQIANVVPGAVSAFDQYGNAISINTGKAREFIKEQVAMMGVMNKKDIQEAESALKELKTPLADAKRGRDVIMKTGTVDVQTGQNYNTRKATQEEIKAAQDKYAVLAKEKLGYETLIKNLNGDALQTAIQQREKDSQSAKETEERKLSYKKKTVAELKTLAEDEDMLAIGELKRREDAKKGVKEETDAFARQKAVIDAFDKKIKDAIAGGNTPLAAKLQIEKKAAEDLLKVWEMLEKQIASGPLSRAKIEILQNKAATSIKASEKLGWKQELTPEQKKQSEFLNKGVSDQRGNAFDEQNKAADQANASGKISGLSDPSNGFGAMSGAETANYAIDQASVVQGAIFDIVKNNQQAAFDSKMSLLDKEREKELSNKNLTEEQKDAINKKYDAKARKLKQDNWKKQQKVAIIDAIIATALSIVKASPVVPLMVAAGIAGAAQIAVIASQKMPEFSSGGPTGSGYSLPDMSGQKPAGIVHADEYVIPAWERKIPQVMAMESIIESIRTRGYAAGGAVSSTATSTTIMQPVDPQMLKAMNRFSDTIDNLQEKGLETNLVYHKLQKFIEKVNKTENSTAL
jgi:hypothetical protein